MKITHIIGLDTLGDKNTTDDNNRFVIAVQKEVESEFPQADVTVTLGEHTSTHVVGDFLNGARAAVQEITNTIWNAANY